MRLHDSWLATSFASESRPDVPAFGMDDGDFGLKTPITRCACARFRNEDY